MANRRKKSKNLTPNQRAYQKELTRIKRFISAAEKRGYIFPHFQLPNMPQRVTQKALNEIKSLKPAKLYKFAQYLVKDTGELVSGFEGRQLERKRAALKGLQTRRDWEYKILPGSGKGVEFRENPDGSKTLYDIGTGKAVADPYFNAISQVMEQLEEYSTLSAEKVPFYKLLLDQLTKVWNKLGTVALGSALIRMADAGVHLQWRTVTYKGQYNDYINQLIDALAEEGYIREEDRDYLDSYDIFEWAEDWEE